jgi:hypothetical protein
MTNKTLVNTALSILRQPNISKIGFELNGLVVTGVRFAEVANAIQMGRISCEVVSKFNRPPGQELPPGSIILARYVPETNTMQFPSESYGTGNAYEKTVILHEATHAMFDLFAKTNDDQVLAIDDESAAVLAQALYIRLCDVDDAVNRFTRVIDGPGELALKLADQMMKETGDFVRDRRTYSLKPDQIVKFRLAVAQEWDLIKDSRSDRTGIKSIYNGVVCSSC